MPPRSGCATADAARGREGGYLLPTALMFLAFLGAAVATFFTLLTVQVRMVGRTVNRAQALYLAEAGLDAANDLLTQDWDAAWDRGRFPLRATLSAAGDPAPLGAYEVRAVPLETDRVQFVASGMSAPSPGGDGVRRTISVIVARRIRPVFERDGWPGALDLQVLYTDQDGVPDLLQFSGAFSGRTDLWSGAETLTGGSQAAIEIGYHMLASFTDVDGDGDLDLVLSDELSREPGGAGAPASPVSGRTLAPDDAGRRPVSMTTADVFGTGHPVPVLAPGWLFLPPGALSTAVPGASTDTFRARIVYDGTRVVSWGEL
ncbi:MAG TPA: hypothetical protein VGB20_05385 [bacterium]